MNDYRQNSAKKPQTDEGQGFQKIQFRINTVSSEEEGYPVTELLNHTPFSRGWQSSRFSDYPQEILLEFNSSIKLRQIQFLSHQYKIASRIEILVYNPLPSEIKKPSKFKKVGYLSLDSNERSNYQARELKSVFLDYQCQKINILLHRCHTNSQNIFSQVGLIAINILGNYMNNSGDFVNENYILGDKIDTKLEDEMIYDPVTLKRLKALYKAKEKMIELEDFDEAKKIKDSIDRLKSVSQQLIQLEERKTIAIKNDDFDAAKMLKYEIERLRNAVAGINLNGNTKPEEILPNKNNFQDDPYNVNYNNQNNRGMSSNSKSNNNNTKKTELKGLSGGYPVSSDMIIEEEKFENNKNIKSGYQLQDKTDIKKRMEIEEQQVKGGVDFNKMVQEQMEKEGIQNKGGNEAEEDIPANEMKKAEPLIQVLSYDIVKLLFQKYWKQKEEGIRLITEEVKNHPKSKILGQHQVDQIIISIMGACAYVLSCNVSQVLMSTIDLIKIMFNKFRGVNISGYTRTDFNNHVDSCLILLIEKIGDANLKLKEKSENSIIEMANNPLIGHKIVYEHLIKGQVKKQLLTSAKHISGRLMLISRMIDNFGLDSNDVPINTLMDYAINSFKNPNKEVRDASYQLIMNCYKYIGDTIRNHFKDLRPAQITTLEEGFEQLDGLNSPVENTNKKNINTSSKKPVNKQQVNSEDEDSRSKSREQSPGKPDLTIENLDSNNSQMIKGYQYEDPTKCSYCGHYDPNFDQDALDLHQFKECPILHQCFRCRQTIEISSLNYHYLNECDYKKEFKTCQRCKEPVHSSNYDQHVQEKICSIAKNPTLANRCPLCHTDITPAGKVGWDKHLLQIGCMYNPRTNS